MQVSLGLEVNVTADINDQVFTRIVSLIASEAEFTPKNIQNQEMQVHMVFAVKILLWNSGRRLELECWWIRRFGKASTNEKWIIEWG